MFFNFIEINKNPICSSANVKSEVFKIGKIGDFSIHYAPLLGKVYACDTKSSSLLPQASEHTNYRCESNSGFDLLTISLTSNCNLRCAYCYANAGKTRKAIDFEFVKKAIDFMSDNSNRLSILFHGGGEQTLEFGLMKKITEYARKSKDETHIRLQTNAVFPNEVRDWVSKNLDRISISCDGPAYIQNLQRPFKNGGKTSTIVEKNIRYFIENSKDVGVASVISKFSADKQTEILSYFYKIGVEQLAFTPVRETGRCITCPSLYSSTPGSKIFINNLLKTSELADIYGIKFSAPISYKNPMGRPCGLSGKSFFITVDGFVGSCLAVTSKDSEYNELFFGHFDKKNARIIIDEKKLDFLRKRITQNIPACQNCFMKWNCAGGCAIASCLIYGRDIYSPDTRFCKSNRKLCRELLLYKVQKDLIKIKPFLEERSGKMIYNGVFNEFELAEFPNMKSGVGVMLRIDINKSNLATLTNKLIKSNPRLALLSFKITQRNLNLELGQKIEKFLKALKSNRVAFIIARPLPRCIFNQKYDELIKEFKIPKNCGECLELFLVKGDSFHVCKTNKKIPQNKIKTREDIYEFFKEFSKIPSTLPCNTCVYRLRQKCNGCVCE